MGADLVLVFDCPVKQHLARGDVATGSERLYKLTKQRSQAETIARVLAADGKDPATTKIGIGVSGPDGLTTREVTVASMMEATAVLDELAHHCEDCPASVFSDTFGCVSYLHYPITESAEAWLARRIQPADRLGGWLLLKAIKDFGYHGEKLAGWRKRGLLESKAPTWQVVKKGFLSSTKVSADQVLEAVLTVGAPLQPSHCMMVLLFLGALALDGEVPTSKDDPEALATLHALGSATRDQRAARTSLEIGDESDAPGVDAMQGLVAALYEAYVLGVPLWIDA